MDAVVDGTLGIKGDTGLTDDALQKHSEARRKRNDKFWKQRAGQDQARRIPNIIVVGPGTTVFVETSVWERALGDACREHRCRQVDDSAFADIWDSRDPAKPSGKTHLGASMKGGLVVPPAWRHTPPGIVVVYQRALRLTRRMYVSAACRAAHPDGMLALHRMVELGRCDTAGSSCRTERNWDTCMERASGRSSTRG